MNEVRSASMSMQRVLAVLALCVISAACVKSRDTAEPPAELTRIDATLDIEVVWRANIGDAGGPLRLGIAPATDGTNVYAASRDGDVAAYAAADGERLWSVDVDHDVSAGPAVGDGAVAVVSLDGHITVLSAADGSLRWSGELGSEVLAAPAIGRGRVVVHLGDGRVVGLDLLDGSRRWSIAREAPPISLRGSSAPIIAGDRAIVGTDAGRALAVRLEDGRLIWDTPVAIPRGATLIERIVDVDGRAVVVGTDVFVVSYQGRVAMLGLESGQVFWAVDADSNRTPAVDAISLFLSTSDGELQRMDRRSGSPRWTQDAFRARVLTSPALQGDSIVVGDLEGYLHWVGRDQGALQARARVGSSQVLDPMLTVGDLLIAQSLDGRISAFRIAGD